MKTPEMTLYGVSVCPAGEENYERFEARRGKWFFQYDYRYPNKNKIRTSICNNLKNKQNLIY
ncbi:MAG: DUF3873 domain-containing protein [Prevotellaceae bacterium]|nr:DUF3873 domain-containing protein [Prevotellaceae bacterium]